MNCPRCQYELSQCLDGRLGSGRRAVVMRHVEGCDACAAFWDELQKAQELVLGLPPERVTPGFRAQLWERIRSGEGTPDAVFREPVPLVSKVRYVLSGAAAAAAVLVALYVAAPPDGVDSPVLDQDIARRGQPVVITDAAPRPVNNGVIPVQLSPPLLAENAARNLQSNYRRLSDAVDRLDDLGERDLIRVCDQALEAKSLGEMLVYLESDDYVQFSPSVAHELRFFNAYLDQGALRRRQTVDVVRSTIVPVVNQARNLARLEREMTILYRPNRQDVETERLVTGLFEIARLHPEGFKYIPLNISQSSVMSCEVVPEFQSPAKVFFWQDGHSTWSSFPMGGMPRQGIQLFVRVHEGVRVMELKMGDGGTDVRARRVEVERELRRDK